MTPKALAASINTIDRRIIIESYVSDVLEQSIAAAEFRQSRTC